MHELLSVVAHEISELGTTTTVLQGTLPALEPDDVYVVVPHEYFILTPRPQHPTAQQLERTIAFCVEHPGTDTFEASASWAARVGGVVDIGDASTAALQDRGIPAVRFRLGYSSDWDVWRGGEDRVRDIDVTYLGTTESRRSRALATYSERLAPWNVKLLMPPHEQMTRTRPDFLTGAAKLEWLADSKILLNLHRGLSTSLEWVRVLEALCNGCVVVSEHSAGYEPLVPGRHIVFGRWRSLGDLAATLLDNPQRLQQIRHDAYEFLTTELTMRSSAARLIELAEDLVAGVRRDQSSAPTGLTGSSAAVHLLASDDSGRVYGLPAAPKLDPDARRALARTLSMDEAPPAPRLKRRPPRGPRSVDALVVQLRDDLPPDDSVASILEDDHESSDVRVFVGVDSRNRPVSRALPSDGRVVLDVRDRPELIGVTRNRLLAGSDAEYVLVLDPTDVLLPGGLSRLVDALSASPSSAACYPLTAEPSGEIGNALPFEPWRVAHYNYIGAPALWRREALVTLGGWCQEPELQSFEDYDLWLRLAAADGVADLLPQVLVRRRARPVTSFRPCDADPNRTLRTLRARSGGRCATFELVP
jgi:hypothetical protein